LGVDNLARAGYTYDLAADDVPEYRQWDDGP
jgi:hypothetical protein